MFAGGSPWPVVLHTHTMSGAVGSWVTSNESMGRQCTRRRGRRVIVCPPPSRAASRAMRSATSRAFPVSDPYRTRSGGGSIATVARRRFCYLRWWVKEVPSSSSALKHVCFQIADRSSRWMLKPTAPFEEPERRGQETVTTGIILYGNYAVQPVASRIKLTTPSSSCVPFSFVDFFVTERKARSETQR